MDNQNKNTFLQLSIDEQKLAIETLLFASDEPIDVKSLINIFISEGFKVTFEPNESIQSTLGDVAIDKVQLPNQYFEELIEQINFDLLSTNRPYFITKIAGGYQFATRPENGEFLQKLSRFKVKRRLSQAALESIAIIAYKQPITKPEIEQIRGVNSNEIVNNLLEKKLIQIVGRKDVLGKPIMYGTTQEFLKVFGLNSLDELPKLRELEDFNLETQQEMPELVIEIDEKEVDEKTKEKINEFHDGMPTEFIVTAKELASKKQDD